MKSSEVALTATSGGEGHMLRCVVVVFVCRVCEWLEIIT